MAQISQPWDGTVLGDATRARYSSDEWADMYQEVFGSLGMCGVIPGVLNELEVTESALNTVDVDPGAAMVYGRWYENDDALSLNVPNASAGNWREDCVILRCSWGAQTIRAVVKTNTTGENTDWDSDTMLTQNDGTTWEIPLAAVQVDDAGDLTVTDIRHYIYGPRKERWFGEGDFAAHDVSAPGYLYGWQFDPAATEHLYFSWVIPKQFRGNQFRIFVYFTGGAAANTGVVWRVYGYSYAEGVAPNTWSLRDEGQIFAAGNLVSIVELTDTVDTGNHPVDICDVGDFEEMWIARLGAVVGDDYPNDAQLLGVLLWIA